MGSRRFNENEESNSANGNLSEALRSILEETCGQELERGESYFGRASVKKADDKVMSDNDPVIEEKTTFSRKLSIALKLPRSRARMLNVAIVKGKDISDIRRLANAEDVNAPDDYGKTPLHCAAASQNLEAVELLLKRKVNVNVLDDRGDTPLHAAVRTGNVSLINTLLNSPKINVNLSGPDTKTTPLHLVAQLDHPNSISICRILMGRNADLFIRDNQKMTAIGYAAKKGYHELMQCFFSYARVNGKDTDDLLYEVDDMDSTLLHLAVASGNQKAVAACLENGSRVDRRRKSDGTTAVHIACTRGPYLVVKLILESVSYAYSYSLADNTGLTCLHRAAKHNQPAEIVQLLLDQGIAVNPRDNSGKTPLMCAVSRGCDEATKVLLKYGADMTVRDKRDRNVLHLAVGSHTTLRLILKHEFLKDSLIKGKDKTGSTPLHHAAKGGYPLDVELLLARSTDLAGVQNANEDAPLHLAVSNGWLKIVQLLLDGPNARMVNCLDKNERTPLHLASKNGHVEIVDFLLQTGASIQRDRYGQTALHHAAWVGSLAIVDLLLSNNFFCLNQKDKRQEMALHLAVQSGHASLVEYFLSIKDQELAENTLNQNILDIAITCQHKSVALVLANHRRWREVLCPPSRSCPSQMELLVERMPEVAERFLDRCIRKDGRKDNPDHKITYNLHFLQGMPDYERCKPKNSLKPLYAMVKHKRLNCLQHPTSLALINIKWRKYGLAIVLINQIMSILYLCSVIALVAVLTDNPCFTATDKKQCANSTTNLKLQGDPSWPKRPTIRFFIFLKVALITLSVIKLLNQLIQMYSEGWRYLTKFSYLLELTLCITMMVFLLPENCSRCFGAGAIAACMAWFSLMSRIARVSFLGIYLMMLAKIFVTVVRVFVLLFMFLLCFAFSFYVLNFEQVLFSDIFQSMATTFVMLMGEVNYAVIFLENTRPLHHPYLLYPLFLLFCLGMPIIFLNLLIGLAVGDIASIQKIATLERYSAQVEQLYNIEQMFPRFILKRWQMRKHVDYPNRTKTLARRIYDVIVGTLTTAGYEEEQKENEVEKIIEEQEERLKSISGQLDTQSSQLEFMRGHMERIEQKLTGSKDRRFITRGQSES